VLGGMKRKKENNLTEDEFKDMLKETGKSEYDEIDFDQFARLMTHK
jgi:Ca2+-binding EF-hand superfamily protein